MANIIDVYKNQLENRDLELKEILEKMTPLEQKRERIEKEIEALKYLLESEQERKMVEFEPNEKNLLSGPMFGMTGKEAYKEAGKNYFQDKPFKEPEIREYTTQEGLRIRNKEKIGKNTSWGIIKELNKEGIFEKVDRGLYRHKNADLIQNSYKQEDPRKIINHIDSEDVRKIRFIDKNKVDETNNKQ